MISIITCLLIAAPAAPATPLDPIAERLFPPDLIMANQTELHIDDKQRDSIMAEMQKTQGQLLPLEWQMKGATEEMTKLLEPARIDEAEVLAIADTIMGIERQFKRNHLALLIRIRNLLTDDQRAKLGELRKASPHP